MPLAPIVCPPGRKRCAGEDERALDKAVESGDSGEFVILACGRAVSWHGVTCACGDCVCVYIDQAGWRSAGLSMVQQRSRIAAQWRSSAVIFISRHGPPPVQTWCSEWCTPCGGDWSTPPLPLLPQDPADGPAAWAQQHRWVVVPCRAAWVAVPLGSLHWHVLGELTCAASTLWCCSSPSTQKVTASTWRHAPFVYPTRRHSLLPSPLPFAVALLAGGGSQAGGARLLLHILPPAGKDRAVAVFVAS